MRSFNLRLQDATHAESIEDVIGFVGEDDSGSFGIQAGHGRMMTSLSFGLARFKLQSGDWKYVALPGALLYFNDDVLTLSTRHFVVDDDYQRISEVMREQLVVEEAELKGLKESLRRMEEEVLRRMWQLGKAGALND